MGEVRLPLDPMVPISSETVPEGEEWGYQLKWDGIRIIASVRSGEAVLYSRSGLNKNDTYPELAERLSRLKGRFILDGEAVVFDPDKQRPVFQKVLQRERMRRMGTEAAAKYPVTYVLFDLLEWKGASLLKTPYAERYERLRQLFPERAPDLFVTDTFSDWKSLWKWVVEHEWEGIVSKRLESLYHPGKQHRDWFKKKIKQVYDVGIVAFTYREGRLASLVMTLEGAFFGKVSLGLNMSLRQRLDQYARENRAPDSPFPVLPGELKGETVVWLRKPVRARVQGLEVTDAGLLRHPKLIELTLPEGG